MVIAVLSTLVRLLINFSFWFFIIGTTINGVLAAPLVYNGKSKLSSTWFKQENIGFTTIVVALLTFFASILGYFGPLFFFRNFEFDEDNEEES